MILLLLVKFIAFPDRKDSIISKNPKAVEDLTVTASGAIGYYYNRECHITVPNSTLYEDKRYDWCSNIAPDKKHQPWISYSFKHSQMKLTGYSVRNGCCWYDCCCLETGEVVDYICCCRLYSFSLHGSNDNVSWKLIHKVEKELRFYECEYKHYDFPLTESFRYIKFVMDQQRPGCPRCMQINQMELYGITVDTQFSSYEDDDNDESISIIGKVKKAQE